jgi:hypothetical protein
LATFSFASPENSTGSKFRLTAQTSSKVKELPSILIIAVLLFGYSVQKILFFQRFRPPGMIMVEAPRPGEVQEE